jgi:hypothetical protein
MKLNPLHRLSTAALALAVWVVLAAGVAHAKPGPEDASADFVTQPAIVVAESVSWTRYALIAVAACLIGIAATLAVQSVVRHSRHTSAAHA